MVLRGFSHEAECRYGHKDVKGISSHVKTRNPTQVRTHAQKFYLRLDREAQRARERMNPQQLQMRNEEVERWRAQTVCVSYAGGSLLLLLLLRSEKLPRVRMGMVTVAAVGRGGQVRNIDGRKSRDEVLPSRLDTAGL